MRTNSRRRGWGLVLAVLTLVVSLPELARAQQTGLFPNAPIRRQRVPCDQQDPIYNTIKYQYFGYHPTAWRRFPAGWGYPSPEKPDRQKAFKERPLETPRGEGELPPEFGPGPMEEPTPGRPALPAIPRQGQSPFEQPSPTQPGAAPGAAPGGRREISPSPFDLEKPDTPRAPDAPRAGRSRPPASRLGDNGPALSAPTTQPDPAVGSESARRDVDEGADPRQEGGPLLAIPNVDVPPVTASTTIFGTEPPPGVAVPPGTAPDAAAAPAASTPRRGFLSTLLDSLGVNWTRR
jgi:hypothetical protein